MRVKKAIFLGSFVETSKCPAPKLPEYAFIGRSNVGKSSLVNALTGQKSLAHVSATPGKTQTLNFYLIDDTWHLVDLPGYGWAQVSKEKKEAFATMTRNYLLNRENLLCTFVLVDIRLPRQENDRAFMRQMALDGLPFAIVFTKADKLSATQRSRAVEAYKNQLWEDWEELPEIFITSAEAGIGLSDLLGFILRVNLKFKKN